MFRKINPIRKPSLKTLSVILNFRTASNGAGPLSKDSTIALIIILVGCAGFGLGRLSRIAEMRVPVSIEGATLMASPAASAVAEGKGAATTGQFVASRNGATYSLPTCPTARAISEANKIWFGTKQEAEHAGYRPAANCKGIVNSK